MTLYAFINKATAKDRISFNDTMAIISEHYVFTPTRFCNGLGENCITNEPGSNEGSCKIFAFAKLNQLNKDQTLNLFGDYYHDVMNDPKGNGHQNIRNFMQYGWEGVNFNESNTLQLK